MKMQLDSAVFTLHAVQIVTAIGVSIASIELLLIRDFLQDEGLMSWRIRRLSQPALMFLDGLPAIGSLLRYPGIMIALWICVPMPIVLTVTVAAGCSTFLPLFLLCTANLFKTLHSSAANDGSDQMATIVLVASLLAEAIGTRNASAISLVFIAAQAALAYGTSGFLKAITRGWNNGYFVVEVLKTGSFGHASLCRFVEGRPWLARLLGWMVTYGDCVFSI